MAKSRERSEVEVLRAENKRLTKQVKELQRTLGRLQKRAYRVEEIEDIFEDLAFEEMEKVSQKIGDCPKCLQGKLSTTDLGIRKFQTCESCDFRKMLK